MARFWSGLTAWHHQKSDRTCDAFLQITNCLPDLAKICLDIAAQLLAQGEDSPQTESCLLLDGKAMDFVRYMSETGAWIKPSIPDLGSVEAAAVELNVLVLNRGPCGRIF
ncbi:MAG: hypothetical protein M2R45_01149 [Verrucomicrobia subdivision 3 bacterium]|nr:hypothetical protein [Limisphaerales bacterium]